MPDSNMQEYYRHRAPEYEQIYFRDNPPRRKEIDDEANRLRDLVRGRHVLEFACGTGYWTQIMADTAAAIHALDLSEEMIAQAKMKDFTAPVRFEIADMYAHEVDGADYDVVALGFWFSHHPRENFEQLFDILERGLKPGGYIWMVDNNPPAEGPTNESVRVDENGNNYKRRYLDDGSEFVIMKNYFQEQELYDLLSGRFSVKNLVYGRYYWSAVFQPGA
jgi:demethylmenaquinone methyltransferase/2-methoxy-6-polyprenyl-1,4-benzoquinol methylase